MTMKMTEAPLLEDLLHRQIPTPFEADYLLGEFSIRVSTNSRDVLRHLSQVLPSVLPGPDKRIFGWRIVVETASTAPAWRKARYPSYFSHNGLSFLSLGRAGFVAFDCDAFSGVAFLSTEQLDDGSILQDYALPNLKAALTKTGSAEIHPCPSAETGL